MPISREDATALIFHLTDAINRGDKETLLELYAEDATIVSPALGERHGREAIAQSWVEMFSGFPDWKVAVADVFVDGDRVLAFGTNSFTDGTGWFGLSPTGRSVGYRAGALFTLAGSKIVRDERLYDVSAVTELLEKTRLEQELKTAALVQSALLSQTLRRGTYYEAIGDSVPCRTIGGDFFEFTQLPSGELGIALGDVAGKGPPAALLAAMLQGMLAVEAQAKTSPSTLMSRLNKALLLRGLGSQFATLVYGVLSPDGRFVYSNAGHNPPILLSGGSVRRLTIGGPIVGAFPDSSFEEESVQLQDGNIVVMFTDGVTEAANENGEEFGEDRLISCLVAAETRSAAEIVQSVLTAVREFCGEAHQADDITLTVTRFRAK